MIINKNKVNSEVEKMVDSLNQVNPTVNELKVMLTDLQNKVNFYLLKKEYYEAIVSFEFSLRVKLMITAKNIKMSQKGVAIQIKKEINLN